MTIEVWNPRWPRQLARMFNARGSSGSPLTVLDDVMPVVGLADGQNNEAHFQRGEVPWSIFVTTTAVAAQFSQVCLTLAKNGFLAVVEQVWVGGAATAMQVQLGTGVFAGLTPSALVNHTDARSVRTYGLQSGVLTWGAGTSAAAFPVSPIAGTFVAANGVLQQIVGWDSAFVFGLEPNDPQATTLGNGFTLQAGTVNVAFSAMMTGYWRLIDQGELGQV